MKVCESCVCVNCDEVFEFGGGRAMPEVRVGCRGAYEHVDQLSIRDPRAANGGPGRSRIDTG